MLDPKVVPIPTVLSPKELNCNTDPIPTGTVPKPTDSTGSKYTSLFRLKLKVVLNPELMENLLVSSVIIDPTVWADPTVPFTALNTLILELFLSKFKTFTFSVPIPRISFGTRFDLIKLESTLKKVTNPVIFVFPTATPVVPNPTILNTSLETPTVYDPSILDEVVETPLILIISRSERLFGSVDSTM